MCDNINLLIVLKLYDAIDRRAMLSCDNSGYCYLCISLRRNENNEMQVKKTNLLEIHRAKAT